MTPQQFINRKKTRVVNVGDVKLGGDNPIAIQSMTNTNTADANATAAQIRALEEVGCEIVRVAVPDVAAANAIGDIMKQVHIPVVADIHFNFQLAIKAMEQGITALRINPGNIGERERTIAIVKMAKERGIPIRIGVNSGSLEKGLLEQYGLSAKAMVESAVSHIRILEELDFHDIVVSLKASNVPLSVEAYRLASQTFDYPLHLGITEAGTVKGGSIKSAVGLGIMLADGIGDTLRVSLTGDPLEEIYTAKEILKAVGVRRFGVEFISCPTCGRTKLDLITIANQVEALCMKLNKNISVAVMGCAVNGPGEAKEADIGIAGGSGEGLIFKKGVVIAKVPEDQLVSALMAEIDKM